MKIPISLLLVIAMGVQALADQKLIESICKGTPIYELCITTIRAVPGSDGANVVGLSLIMINAVESKSKEALSAVENLIKGGNPELLVALNDCSNRHKVVIEADVPEARRAIMKGVPHFADDGMADAKLEVDSCEAAFRGKSPLTAVNKAVSDLAVVARAVISNLL